jgi:PAS domain S-box-containing protein
LVNTANAPIFGVDINGHVNIWNAKTAELTGYKKEEAINKPLVNFFHDDIQGVFDETLKGHAVDNYQYQHVSRSGEIRHLLINFSARRDGITQEIVGGVAVSQDVTESALHDRAVASMANELRQLVDTANAPIFGIDVRGTVNEWNNKTAEITGYSSEEAIGKPLVSTFIVKNLRESVQRVMDLALQGNETSNYELEFRTKVS